MENIEYPKPGKRDLDPVSQEDHNMFMEHQVDTLQEALHIQKAEELILQYVKEGRFSLTTPLDEVLEKLEERKGELIGDDDEDLEDDDPHKRGESEE